MSAAQEETTMLRSALSSAEQARDDAIRQLDILRVETRQHLIEAQHRFRNTVSTIRAIVHRTAEEAEDVPEYCGLLDGRLTAYLNVQVAVAADLGTGVDLELIIRDELLKFGIADQARCEIEGPPLQLGHRAAGLVALMIYELVSQLVVAGFEWSGGHLHATWTIPPDDEHDVVFVWTVSGGRVYQGTAPGWLESLRDAIHHQLSGRFTEEITFEKTVITVFLPANKLIAST